MTGSFILSTFVGEKYLLTREFIPPVPDGADELLQSYGASPSYLYRNNLWVPLSLVFHHYVPEQSFRQLTRQTK